MLCGDKIISQKNYWIHIFQKHEKQKTLECQYLACMPSSLYKLPTTKLFCKHIKKFGTKLLILLNVVIIKLIIFYHPSKVCHGIILQSEVLHQEYYTSYT